MPSTLCFSSCATECPPKCALNDSKQGNIDRTFPISDIGEGSDITAIDTISKDGQNIFTKLWELLCRGPKLWKPPEEDHVLEKLSYTHAEEPTWPRIGLSQAAHNKSLGPRGNGTGKAEDTNTCLKAQRSGMYLDWYHLRAEQSKLLHLDNTNGIVVSGSYDNSIRAYDFATGELILAFLQWTTSWVLSAKSDYRRIVAASQDSRTVIMDFGYDIANVGLLEACG